MIMHINNDSPIKRLLGSLATLSFVSRSKARASNISSMLFKRILTYTECFEFINSVSIPDDFQIKYSILNMHMWLLMNRLKEINVYIHKEHIAKYNFI